MQHTNTIYIIGAGAIGRALAVCLQQEGKDVILLRGSVNDGADYWEELTIELADNIKATASIKVSTISNFATLDDGIVVLANKSYGNQHLAELLQHTITQAPLVILQNGLNVEQPFLDKGFPEIYRCVLFATSQPLSPTTLRFRPVQASPIGVIKGNDANAAAIVHQLHNRYFPFRAEENIQPVIWTKAIVNSVFNSICPLLETDNGIFHRNEKVLGMAKRVITECISIAEAKGIHLDTEKVIHTLLMISKLSDGQFISTYQDIKHKRPTEIATLNIAIVDMAKALGKAEMVKETGLLGELVEIRSQLIGWLIMEN